MSRRVVRRIAATGASIVAVVAVVVVAITVYDDDEANRYIDEEPRRQWELVAEADSPFGELAVEWPRAAVAVEDTILIGGGGPHQPSGARNPVLWRGSFAEGWEILGPDELGEGFDEGLVADLAVVRTAGREFPRVVAVGAAHQFNSAIVWLSDDAGASWTAVSGRELMIGDATNLTAIDLDPATGELVAVGRGLRRPDGIRGTTWRSVDGGLTWVPRSFDAIDVDTPTYEFTDIAVRDGREVVVGTALFSDRRPEPAIWVGENGDALQRVPLGGDTFPASVGFAGVTFVEGHGFAAFGAADDGQPAVWLSSDGTQWQRVSDESGAFPSANQRWIIHDVAAVNGAILAAGSAEQSAVVWETQDLTTWTKTPLPDGTSAAAIVMTEAGPLIVGEESQLRTNQASETCGRLWQRVIETP